MFSRRLNANQARICDLGFNDNMVWLFSCFFNIYLINGRIGVRPLAELLLGKDLCLIGFSANWVWLVSRFFYIST